MVIQVSEHLTIDKACADLTNVQEQKFHHRITDSESNPDNVMTWQEIKAIARSTFRFKSIGR